jgi:hypothetical protein
MIAGMGAGILSVHVSWDRVGGQCPAFGEDSCHSSLERGRKTAMKKVLEVEEKVTSSLNICPEAGGGRSNVQ